MVVDGRTDGRVDWWKFRDERMNGRTNEQRNDRMKNERMHKLINESHLSTATMPNACRIKFVNSVLFSFFQSPQIRPTGVYQSESIPNNVSLCITSYPLAKRKKGVLKLTTDNQWHVTCGCGFKIRHKYPSRTPECPNIETVSGKK